MKIYRVRCTQNHSAVYADTAEAAREVKATFDGFDCDGEHVIEVAKWEPVE